MSNRLASACKDKLYYIEHISINDYNKEFYIMGSTGNVYNINIGNKYSCTCPDFKYRFKKCKHIYFVILRVLNNIKYIDNKSFTNEELSDMFSNIVIYDKQILIDDYKKNIFNMKKNSNDTNTSNRKSTDDDICPICLDEFSNLEDTYYCKNSCGKNVHKNCFDMWVKSKGHTCVFCNANWNFESDKSSYINLNKI